MDYILQILQYYCMDLKIMDYFQYLNIDLRIIILLKKWRKPNLNNLKNFGKSYKNNIWMNLTIYKDEKN